VVKIGCSDPALITALRAGDQYLVHALDTDPARVAAAREHIINKGVYGPVSVDHWDGRRLPYAENLVNLIVAEQQAQVSEAELLRALAPRGLALIRKDGQWKKLLKPWPEEMDEWTHYLHDADGNPAGRDSMAGPPERLRWIGSPRWARHHDIVHSTATCLAIDSTRRIQRGNSLETRYPKLEHPSVPPQERTGTSATPPRRSGRPRLCNP